FLPFPGLPCRPATLSRPAPAPDGTAWPAAAAASAPRGRAEVLAKEGEGPAPGEIGGRLVVAGAGVVVEGVLDARIHVHDMGLARGLEGGFVGGDPGIDAGVVLRVVQQQRRLDRGDL